MGTLLTTSPKANDGEIDTAQSPVRGADGREDPDVEAEEGPDGLPGVDVEAADKDNGIKARSLQITVIVEDQNPCLRILTYIAAVALFLSSLIAILNFFFLFRFPVLFLSRFPVLLFPGSFPVPLYVLMGYNMFCAAVIIVMDGKFVWFRRWASAQARLFRMIPCLASRPGRAFFYIAVGGFNLSFLGWSLPFAVCGGLLNVCGFLTLLTSCCCR